MSSDSFFFLPVPMEQLTSSDAAGDGDGAMHLTDLLAKV